MDSSLDSFGLVKFSIILTGLSKAKRKVDAVALKQI